MQSLCQLILRFWLLDGIDPEEPKIFFTSFLHLTHHDQLSVLHFIEEGAKSPCKKRAADYMACMWWSL